MTRLLLVCCTIAWCLLPADLCRAGRRRVFARRRVIPHHAVHRPYVGHPTRRQLDQRNLRIYPKYYGGFHARYFDTLGIPSGDIGLRGNGIYPTPW